MDRMNQYAIGTCMAQKTGYEAAVCMNTLAALEDVSGSVLLARIRGKSLDASGAACQIAAGAGIPQEQCQVILNAFEEILSEALSAKLRLPWCS